MLGDLKIQQLCLHEHTKLIWGEILKLHFICNLTRILAHGFLGGKQLI